MWIIDDRIHYLLYITEYPQLQVREPEVQMKSTSAATGKSLNDLVIFIDRFVGGKIAEEWQLSALSEWKLPRMIRATPKNEASLEIKRLTVLFRIY